MINYLTVTMSARKVLIMEPNDCAFLGISHILRDVLGLNPDHVPDCPNALKQIRDALKKSAPYDLLITEFSGTERGNETRELIKEATGIQPALRTLLYTSEVRPLALKAILREPGVNGYVLKNGHGSSQVVKAIRNIGKSGFYLSPEVDELINQVHHISLEGYDFRILTALAEGYSQREIAQLFNYHKIHPSSLSSIEKRINQLKDRFQAKNNVHLIAKANILGAL